METAHLTAGWLLPTEAEDAAYDGVRSRFGRTDRLRCPFLDDGGCGIWIYRNATCATWFCRHGDGVGGAAMWDAATELLRFAEAGVAVWSSGDEYQRAADRARSLSWDHIRRLGGPELRALERSLQEAWAATQ